jgi:hypothetical protein
MVLIAHAADRLLGAIVPRATAGAWSCPPGCVRKTCHNGCRATANGAYWFDYCVAARDPSQSCTGCRQTAWTC